MTESWESSYLGIPFEMGGRNRDGIDCYGLVVLVFREVFGVDITSFDDLDIESPELHEVWDAAIGSQWVRLSDEEVAPGDVVDVVFLGAPHCGIVVDKSRMLHSRNGAGVVIENFGRGYFCRRVKGIYRHRARM